MEGRRRSPETLRAILVLVVLALLVAAGLAGVGDR